MDRASSGFNAPYFPGELPDPDADGFPFFSQGKYDWGIMTGEWTGDPRIGVRGAIIPSSFFFLERSRGRSETRGTRRDLTSEVDVRTRSWR